MTNNNTGSKYNIGKIEAPQGSVQVGDNGQATTYNTGAANLKEAQQQLFDAIHNSNIPDENKEELTGAIDSVTEEASKVKPNMLSMKGMMDGLTKAIFLFEKTPGIISAFEKWKSFIGGDTGTPPIT